MKVAELIAKLQTMPQDMEVLVCHPGQCCCGDCFLPHDEYATPDPTVLATSTCCGGSGEQAVIL